MLFSHGNAAPCRSRVVARRGAFTLVELLVVIGIIGLLMSILLPAFGKAREQATRTKCLSGVKQFATAFQMYLNDNRNMVCAVNWGAGTCGGKVNKGWLYECQIINNPGPLKKTDIESGAFWQYIKNHEIYRCPGHPTDPVFGKTDTVISYLMNGALNGYHREKLYKVNQFKITDALVFEADERPFNGVPPFNDASSYPRELFDPNTPQKSGLSIRHGKYAVVSFVGGHAEMVPHAEMALRANENKRNWLRCSPEHNGNGVD